MIKSMTAYGRGEYKQGHALFTAEIRSLNQRYRDIIIRMPKNLMPLEADLKTLISSRIRRGRVEVFMEMQNEGEDIPCHLELNLPLVKSYFEIFNQLSEKFALNQKIRLDSLLQVKDVILMKPVKANLEEIKSAIQEALIQALDLLDEMRAKEGKAIEDDMVKRMELLGQYLNDLEKRAPDLIQEYRMRLVDNINSMLKDVIVDESRIAQEVAFFAEKADITEEIVRIRSHLGQFREYLLLEDAIGRRLDFLIQEINREVNTIGSKASDALAAKNVVEMKSELEKLREQIQNVE